MPTKQTLDNFCEEIAREYFGINTLKSQNRDCLDFHDVGVVALKRALEAAYNKGREVEKAAQLVAKWDR